MRLIILNDPDTVASWAATYVKKRILDDAAGRVALWERLQFSLDGEPDPWFDFKEAAVDTRQFDKLTVPA